MTVRVNCWSGPRNVSTALMYAFRQRDDTTVVDEPLYAHYLAVTGRMHPGREAVLRSQATDAAAVVRDVILGAYDTPVVFFKQMAHHLLADVDRAVLARCRNVLLTRDPRDMLPSLTIQLPDAGLADTGLVEQVALLDEARAAGDEPVVIDAAVLLGDPAGVLAEVCERLGLDGDDAMLSWPAGPKPEDGVWAEHWYHNVHASTGFAPHRPKTAPVSAHVEAVLADAVPLYEHLTAHAVGRR